MSANLLISLYALDMDIAIILPGACSILSFIILVACCITCIQPAQVEHLNFLVPILERVTRYKLQVCPASLS